MSGIAHAPVCPDAPARADLNLEATRDGVKFAEHPPKAAEAPSADAGAGDLGGCEAQTPVRAGRAVVPVSVTAVAVAVTGISTGGTIEEQLSRWTNEQAIPSVAVVSPRLGGEATEIVLPGDVEAFCDTHSRSGERLCAEGVANRHRRQGPQG